MQIDGTIFEFTNQIVVACHNFDESIVLNLD